MAGCRMCGMVHRCDSDQCEDTKTLSVSSHCPLLGSSQLQEGVKCLGEHTEDGSVVCKITGICIRMCSYGLEYEVLSRQGFSIQDTMEADSDMFTSNVSGILLLNHATTSKLVNKSSKNNPDLLIKTQSSRKNNSTLKPRNDGVSNTQNSTNLVGGIKKRRRRGDMGGVGSDGVFRIKQGVMKHEFQGDKLCFHIRRLLCEVTQKRDVLFARYLDVCEKRDVILGGIISEQKNSNRPVCMLSVAASLEARVRKVTVVESSMHTVQSFR